jgi:alkanesulfonate monooxygenase SsuD/methylene tetrahydromethanopterin reductase-like flavin-dependent oxidoreductase (luciferase family)
MNYGHRLRLGALVTPEAALALAPAAEAAGLDLLMVIPAASSAAGAGAMGAGGDEVVSVGEVVPAGEAPGDGCAAADPEGLDAWTALSWAAARTTTIKLGVAGLAVPERHPAMIARSAASLDLLSGGRLELVLSGEKTVLAEAVEIIRGLLDAGQPGPLRHLGAHFRVAGAQRGPLPAHRIPISLTGTSPDLLRLTGRLADGWLTTLTEPLSGGDPSDDSSLAGVSAEDRRGVSDADQMAARVAAVVAGQKLIDEAAAAVGREAPEVRRTVVVASGWDEKALLELVVEHGVGTLLLRTDDPEELRRFAAAGLRDRAAEAMPVALPDVFRPASVRAKRRPGIDYDSLPASLEETAVEPGDLDYARVRSTYMRGGAPGLVLRPRTVDEVKDALAFARRHPELPFGLRSRGHGISGRSTNDGGIVVSLAALNSIEILDEEQRLVRVGPGARWMDVAQVLAPYGWALTSGDYGGVGVGGLATAGGVGWLARKHGLTIDKLRAAELILADGTRVRVSDTENPDLFWAVRGAGANFGVVTSFEFQADEVGDVGFAQLVVGAEDPADVLVRWGRAIEEAPRELTGQLIMGRPRAGQPNFAQLMTMVDSDDPQFVVDSLQPVAAAGPLYDQNVVLTSYAGVISNASDATHTTEGDVTARSGLIGHLTPEFARAAEKLLVSGAIHWFQIRAVGGAVADVAPEATAYAHRSANFSVTVMGSSARRVDAGWNELRPYFDGLYISFETGLDRVEDAFPPETLARLRELKRRHDPDNLFRDNFNIDPRGGAL